jgi:hypothetical protein
MARRAFLAGVSAGPMALDGRPAGGGLACGPAPRTCIGSSLAVGPDGAVLARLPYGVDAEAFRAIDVPLAG